MTDTSIEDLLATPVAAYVPPTERLTEDHADPDTAKGDVVFNDSPLTPNDKELLAYFEQHYMLHGVLPSEQKCVDIGFAKTVYTTAIRKKRFHDALSARGMVDRSTIKIQDALTREQLSVANVLLDFRDKRSDAKKLAELDITTAKYNGWLKDPAFQHYMRTRSEQVINENQRDINDALLQRARSGDMGAISYVNKLTGYFDPDKREVTDVNAVLMSVLDILQRKLSNAPDLLVDVAEELLLLAEKAVPVGTRIIAGTVDKPVYEGEVVPVGAPRVSKKQTFFENLVDSGDDGLGGF